MLDAVAKSDEQKFRCVSRIADRPTTPVDRFDQPSAQSGLPVRMAQTLTQTLQVALKFPQSVYQGSPLV
jgi:hypothetical protein